ncbi:MAG: hypothetical protein IJ532_05795 [Alphaproteobacteria bacterium]|nr:hypothetical protein [Alphaproteobacteria bacterium]
MNENKKMFGRSYVPVKNTVILAYFQYDEAGKVFYTMKAVGKLINRKKPISPENVEVFDKHGAFYLYSDEPLMTVDGKQRCLPKAVLTCALSDDPKELENALAKLAGILRHSRPFTKVYNEVR